MYRWPHSVPLWQSTHLMYNRTLLPTHSCTINMSVFPFFFLFQVAGLKGQCPGQHVPQQSVILLSLALLLHTFPTQSYTVMLYFSLYCRPEGDSTLISRNPLLPFCAHKSPRLCLHGMRQIVPTPALLQNSGTVPSVSPTVDT